MSQGKKRKKHQPTHLAQDKTKKKPSGQQGKPYNHMPKDAAADKPRKDPGHSDSTTRHRKYPVWLSYLLAVLATIVVMAGAVVVTGYHGIIPMDPAAFPELSAKKGALNAPDPNAVPSEGNFLVVVNAAPAVAAGERDCRLEVVNLAGNPYPCVVELVRSDTREVLYTSHRIDPGQYMESVKLDRVLEPGRYPCTVQYRLIDPDRVLTTDYPVTLTVGGAANDAQSVTQSDMDVKEASE